MALEKLKQIIARLRNDSTRWDAMLDLKLLNDPIVVEPLIKLLSDRDWVIRWCAAEKLGNMSDLRAVLPMVPLLDDKDGHVSKTALKALEKLGHATTPYLVNQLHNIKLDIRLSVMTLIKKYGEAALPHLVRALDTADWVIANHIAFLVAQIGGPRAEDILIQMLANRQAQKNVIVFLSWMKSKKAISHLVKLMAEPRVRRLCLMAIQVIGTETSYPILIKIAVSNIETAKMAHAAVVKIGTPILPYLARALTKPDLDRIKVIELIQKIGPESIMAEIHYLAEKDADIKLITKVLRDQFPKSGSFKKVMGFLFE